MKKRGQATTFIVLGLIIAIILILVFVYRDEFSSLIGISEKTIYPQEVQEVRDHIQECLEDSAHDSIVEIGLKGGYNEPTVAVVYIDNTFVPIYNYNQNNEVPSLETIQEQLTELTTTEFEQCVDFTLFPEFKFSDPEITLSNTINTNSVDFTLEYPLNLKVKETEYEILEPHQTTINVNLGWMLDISNNIVNKNILEGEINLNYILDQGLASVKYTYLDNETIVYILEDTTSFNEEENYTLVFAEYYP